GKLRQKEIPTSTIFGCLNQKNTANDFANVCGKHVLQHGVKITHRDIEIIAVKIIYCIIRFTLMPIFFTFNKQIVKNEK
ncbi:MAG TPA: hypothetical protein PKX60_06800, partial [Prolixibacteraceae bacterium]|nr:hypothetical protein [Prolixibacteraceae bacterium]